MPVDSRRNPRLRSLAILFGLLLSSFSGGWARAGDDADARARRILATSGVRGGVAVCLGDDAGELAAALGAAAPRLVVRALVLDRSKLERAREAVRTRGEYGRVSAGALAGRRLPFAEHLVDLLVARRPRGMERSEVLRVLAPLGTALLGEPGSEETIRAPWPDDIDEWSHFLHSADNNAVARDARVGPPRRMRWIAGPLWLRSHETESGISAVVTARGRIFTILDEGPVGIVDERLPERWSLIARDAFNGALLWKRPLEAWGWREWKEERLAGKDWTKLYGRRVAYPVQLARRLVAAGDRLLTTLSYTAPLSILDASSGQTLHTVEGTEGTDEIVASGARALVVLRDAKAARAGRRGGRPRERIAMVDIGAGKLLWNRQTKPLVPLSAALVGTRAYAHDGRAALAFDASSGQPLWSAPTAGGRALTLLVHSAVVLVSTAKALVALEAESGRGLWKIEEPADKGASRVDLFVAGGLVWRGIKGVGRDLHTGEVKRRLSTKNLRSKGHHHRCYRNKATDRYLMSAQEGVESLDLAGGESSRDNWVRGSCRYGVLPAGGLLYAPPDQCFCEPGVKLRGFTALSAAPSPRAPPLPPSGPRLVTGPAFREPLAPEPPASSRAAEWPTYRHDRERSGSTPASVPAGTKPLWSARLGGRLSAPVVAGGRLYVARVDAHQLCALSVEDGRRLWTHTAGGRIDSPPTLWRGRVFLGSADGRVTCLRERDGALAWSFRAAPEERLIGAFDQLESAWPVHGSILLQNAAAYFAAGRSSYLDGGIRVFGLDPASGEVRHEALLDGPWPDLEEGPGACFWLDGTRSEILVGDGQRVWLRHVELDGSLQRLETPRISKLGDRRMGLHLFSTSSFLDDSWYNRTYWMYSRRWPGFYLANQAPKSGQLVVFDHEATYALKVFTRRNRHSPMFFPATDGYLLFADDNDNEPRLVGYDGKPEPVEWLPQNEYLSSRGPVRIGARAVDFDKGVGFTRSRPPRWKRWLPVRVRAMLAAGDALWVAGAPDILDPEDPLAALEGRRGAELRCVSKKDGSTLSTLRLDAPPVLDGLAACAGRLYLAARDGKVSAFGRR